MALRWVFNSVFTHSLLHSSSSDKTHHEKLESHNTQEEAKEASRTFQMPLHYPRFAKSDYEKMEEWRVDMLLRQYGLENHIKGSVDEKRKFAMGAFLWPDQM